MISAKTKQLPQLLPVGRYLDGDSDKDFCLASTSRIPYLTLYCLELSLLRTTSRILKTESHTMNEFGT